MQRKPVYIIHPFKGKDGDYESNKAKIENICKVIKNTMPYVLPISPVHSLWYFDESKDPIEREKALECCLDLLEMVHLAGGEAWVCGEYMTSKGCIGEIKKARSLGMKTQRVIIQSQGNERLLSMEFEKFDAYLNKPKGCN